MRESHSRGQFFISEAFFRMTLKPVHRLVKPAHNLQHILFQAVNALCHHADRNAVKCLRDTAGDAGQGVAVSAQRYSRPDHILKIISLQEGRYCLRHRLLAALHMVVPRTDLVAGAA